MAGTYAEHSGVVLESESGGGFGDLRFSRVFAGNTLPSAGNFAAHRFQGRCKDGSLYRHELPWKGEGAAFSCAIWPGFCGKILFGFQIGFSYGRAGGASLFHSKRTGAPLAMVEQKSPFFLWKMLDKPQGQNYTENVF